jgi:hypothetical protein
VSQMVQYPADASIDTPPVWVAHFAHPIEVEWVARAAPAPKDWPRLLLQVSSHLPLHVTGRVNTDLGVRGKVLNAQGA